MYIHVYSIHLSCNSLARGPRFTTFGRNYDENSNRLTEFEQHIKYFDETSTKLELTFDEKSAKFEQ